MKIKIALFLVLFIAIPVCANAYQETQVSRYITLSNSSKKEQIELLDQSIHVRFPQKINTVGKAVNYLLNLSGYDLAPEKKLSPQLKVLLSKPLPIIDREIGSISLKDGLLTLVGKSFYLTDDPINRTVNFKLKKMTVKE